MKNTKISSCRLCGDKNLKPILSLGDQYVNDFPKKFPHNGHKCPVNLIACDRCTVLQLEHTAPKKLLYSNHYWYKSANNQVIVDDLRIITMQALHHFKRPQDFTVLDIGANDGSLLSCYPPDTKKHAVEPAENLQKSLKKHADLVIKDYFPCKLPQKYEIITAIGMFYDLEKPLLFMKRIRTYLKHNGIFIAQLMTAKQMYENMDIGNLCHEHLEYYTLKSLEWLYGAAGLEIFQIEENKINGGSYKIFARHWNKGHSHGKIEKEYNWKFFAAQMEYNRAHFRKFLEERKLDGEKVYGYGASTKGNTILQYFDIGNYYLDGVIDVDKEKIGKHTINGVPIVGGDQINKADWLWALPYGFVSMFVQKEINYKGHWLVTSPRLQVSNYGRRLPTINDYGIL